MDRNIIWQITILETSGVCDYKINIDGSMVIISMFLTGFDKINEYKALALQALKSFRYQRLKVI